MKLEADLRLLRSRAFRHYDRCASLLAELNGIVASRRGVPEVKMASSLYGWLMAPYTLWPIDVAGAANYLVREMGAGRTVKEDFRLLVETLGPPPRQPTQTQIGAFEHYVAKGDYDSLVRCPEKFTAVEAVLAFDGRLTATWARLKKSFRTNQYAYNGVIRRRMSEERNFRRGWQFKWRTARDRFQLLFDAMCYRWQLYGMEGDKPLLLKLAVNPTPHGTLIMIPRQWSLDGDRDLNWKAIGRLHRAHGAPRAGKKSSANRVAMYGEAVEVMRHRAAGRELGLKGERLSSYILSKMGKDPGTDVSWIKRRVGLIRRILPGAA